MLISGDDDAVEAAGRALPGAVVFDVDRSFEQLAEAMTPRDVPSAAVVEQARRNAAERTEFIAEHGVIPADEVADGVGSQAKNRRQTAHRWRKEGAVFAVELHGQLLFPAFQFDLETGKPHPAIREVLELLPKQLDGWALALWWTTPIAVAGQWVVPIELLDDSDRLRAAARQEAADWRRDGAA